LRRRWEVETVLVRFNEGVPGEWDLFAVVSP
jgi:hypothetical protein